MSASQQISPTRTHARQLLGAGISRPRSAPTPWGIARRRWMVRWTKRLLPVAALGLLSTMALWPEFNREQEEARIAFHRVSGGPDGARIVDARYNGLDEHNRPYTVTADTATQNGPDRVDLTAPKADITLENGTWMMLRSKDGVYQQRSSQLDLSGGVTLYRDDGLTVSTRTATMDMKAGAAVSNNWTHAEGPFGTLDAEGFAMTDKGAVVQFTGPARLVLNGSDS